MITMKEIVEKQQDIIHLLKKYPELNDDYQKTQVFQKEHREDFTGPYLYTVGFPLIKKLFTNPKDSFHLFAAEITYRQQLLFAYALATEEGGIKSLSNDPKRLIVSKNQRGFDAVLHELAILDKELTLYKGVSFNPYSILQTIKMYLAQKTVLKFQNNLVDKLNQEFEHKRTLQSQLIIVEKNNYNFIKKGFSRQKEALETINGCLSGKEVQFDFIKLAHADRFSKLLFENIFRSIGASKKALSYNKRLLLLLPLFQLFVGPDLPILSECDYYKVYLERKEVKDISYKTYDSYCKKQLQKFIFANRSISDTEYWKRLINPMLNAA